jgi:hypothetical protein
MSASDTVTPARLQRRQFVIVMGIALLGASLFSHLAIRWLKIKSASGTYTTYGAPGRKASAMLYGSSLAYSGIDWHEVSEVLGEPIGRWAVGGSTPSEWEQFQLRSDGAVRSFVVISTADLNEYGLCDARAAIVPLALTVSDLWHVGADWLTWKRVLSQYPINAVRMFFPTVGRSDGVMTGIRDQLGSIGRRIGLGDHRPEAVGFGPEGDLALAERITDWSPGRFQRRMVLQRAACQGKNPFGGIKKAALMRLLRRVHDQGTVIGIVVPPSPFYQDEFLTPALRHEFEMELTGLQVAWPQTRWIRLDGLPALQDNRMFADFVHLNRDGQRIATRAFLEELATGPKSQ